MLYVERRLGAELEVMLYWTVPPLSDEQKIEAMQDARMLADHIQVTTPAHRYRYSLRGRDVDPVVRVEDVGGKRQP